MEDTQVTNSGQPSGPEQPKPLVPEPQGASGPEQPGPQHSPAPPVPALTDVAVGENVKVTMDHGHASQIAITTATTVPAQS